MPKFILILLLLCAVFTTDGQTFTDIKAGLTGVSESANCWIDYNEDGTPDIFVTGDFYSGSKHEIYSKLYKNQRNDRFTEVTTPVINVFRGDMDWADYDLDGITDLFVIGETATGTKITRLYKNNRTNNLQYVPIHFTGVRDGSVEWGDYDGDGDQDLLITGESDKGSITKLYRNDRNNKFLDLPTGFPQVSFGVARFADYDLDGDLDVVVSGRENSGLVVTELFKNTDGIFIEMNPGLINLQLCDLAWGDYDNDGDLDLVVCGETQQGKLQTQLYNNNKNQHFTPVFPGFISVRSGSLDWGDMDHDGDLDILLTGESTMGPVSKVYRNDRQDIFTDLNADIIGLHMSDGHWADYDNDGDLDVLVSGMSKDFRFMTRVYRNDPFMKADTARNQDSEDIWNNSVVVPERPNPILFYVYASCYADLDGDGIKEYHAFFSPIQKPKVQYEMERKFNQVIRRDYPLWYEFDQGNIIANGFSSEQKAIESK
ncbi:MAG: VCBS repeat-containing protein, partial [Bacteroidales bacterium]